MKTAVIAAAALMATAGTVVARDSVANFATADGLSTTVELGKMTMAEKAASRSGTVMVTYDFATGSLDYGNFFNTPWVSTPITFDPASADYRVLGMEASDIEVTVNHNVGATFENWASELRLGWEDANFGTIGVAPFPLETNGPTGGPGSTLVFTGGSFAFLDTDGTIDIDGDTVIDDFFMPSVGSTVDAFSTYNDGSGLAAGTITGGTITFLLEIPTPGAAALAGIAGLAATRRRR